MLFDNRKTQVIEVEVTQEDIARAESLQSVPYRRPETCPLALALMRTIGGAEWSVADSVAACGPVKDRVWWEHDGKAIVRGFDSHAPVTGTVRLTRSDFQ